MRIEECEAVATLEVLAHERLEQRALSSPGLPENVHVMEALRVVQVHWIQAAGATEYEIADGMPRRRAVREEAMGIGWMRH
jgi:hypothetical protein